MRWSMAVLLVAVAALACSHAAPRDGVELQETDGGITVTIDGQLFTRYIHDYATRPYCFPILGPGQVPLTRSWPMENVPGEEQDHPHHRSMWFAHGDVNGVDFWSEAKGAGRVVQTRSKIIRGTGPAGELRTWNDWLDASGKRLCTDVRTLRFFAVQGQHAARGMDFDISIQATECDLVFGDTKEGTMAVRVAESMKLKGGEGRKGILNSKGDKDGDTWGKRAEWCAYQGQASAGNTAGIAMFDHPGNPRHPTWWHVRDYGLFAANPFGKHDFEKLDDKSAGALKLRKGQSLRFRYRLIFFAGAADQAWIAAQYKDYASGK